MKKIAIPLILIFIFSASLFASTDAESLIIPQTDPIYHDFYLLAQAGVITSVTPDTFKTTPMSSYDAARYIVEGANNLAATSVAPGTNTQGKTAMLRKYFDIYRKKAFEIYNKTIEMRKKVQQAEKLLTNPEVEGFKAYIEEIYPEAIEAGMEHEKTTYRGIPPFKVQGMLTARWQDVESFGVSPVHHTSLGGTFMQLWTEGVITQDINFKLNLTFEKPWNEAEKKLFVPVKNGTAPETYTEIMKYPEYWGTGQRFLDKYTINIGAYGWAVSTGFFWEDITPFVAKSVLSNRPALFDRDQYALEETTKGHYENAFLHSFVARGDIWSKHGFMGIALYNNDLFGTKGRLKIMAGKAEKFDEYYDKLYLYEFAGRYLQPLEFGVINNSYLAVNFFNTSNERAEILTLDPHTVDSWNWALAPDGYKKAVTIIGGDTKIGILDFLELTGEIEVSDYHGYMKPFLSDSYPPRVNCMGNAMFGQVKLKTGTSLTGKFTKIDPTYLADASAIIDTTNYQLNALPDDTRHAKLEWNSFAGDPTLLYNNTQRMDLLASVPIPGGFLNFTYGTASQINPTNNRLYVDHFVSGNRLTGPMWWHLFYSSYGYPDDPAFSGFWNYNDPDGVTGGLHRAGTYGGKRYLITDKWLTNKEIIVLDVDPLEPSKKYTNNASVELKLQLNKLLGMKDNLFIQGYGELVTVWPGSDLMVTFGDRKAYFTQNLISGFLYYNPTRKIGLMAEASIERWSSSKSVKLTDRTEKKPIEYLDNSYGLGLDYDFAPRTSLYLRAKRFFHQDLYYKDYRDTPTSAWKTQDFDGWFLFMEVKNFF